MANLCAGYFHRAIMMSGNALVPWGLGRNHRDNAYIIAKVLDCHTLADEATAANCTTDDIQAYHMCLVDYLPSQKIMQCLRDAPLDILTQSALWFIVS